MTRSPIELFWTAKKKEEKDPAYFLFGNKESLTKLGKSRWDIRKIRKVHLEN